MVIALQISSIVSVPKGRNLETFLDIPYVISIQSNVTRNSHQGTAWQERHYEEVSGPAEKLAQISFSFNY